MRAGAAAIETTSDHENVLRFSDRRAGLDIIIALHRPLAEVAMGGTRLLPYSSDREALLDALRLSEAMTYKAAAAGLPVGGAKAVIIGDPLRKSGEMFRAYARFVDSLRGRFITGQDLNVSMDDVRIMAEETPHVVGLGAVGPAEMTARGVVVGLASAARLRFGWESFAGVRVAVQGVGAVGARVAEILADDGAKLFVADRLPSRALAVANRTLGTVVDPEGIVAQDVDVFVPCAHGAVLNEESIPRLKARLVGGAANNQLAAPERDAASLEARGITYCPDFVINAGGLIEVYCEYARMADRAAGLVAKIGETMTEILADAQRTGMSSHAAALALAARRCTQIAQKQNNGHSKPFFSERDAYDR